MKNEKAKEQKIFTIKIGGQAGQGVKSAGLTLAKVASRSGYYIYTYTEYPSLIQGGHNVMQVNISAEEVTGPVLTTDFLVALNQETIDLHKDELPQGGGILYDEGKKLNVSEISKGIELYPVPLSQLAAEAGGKELLSNTVSLGAITAILGGNINLLKTLVSEEFSKKGEEIIKINHEAVQKGYDYVTQNFSEHVQPIFREAEALSTVIPRMIINGNEGAALGAITAGMQFAAIYPMSPISNILHVLAAHQEEYDYVYKQPEDEISAINMAIGASHAGVRSMTATSGGGFCLMTEGYGLAGITETPLVIIEGMRGAPATGLPTWSEQGDLRFILHAHQGEFPKIILAAGDAKETFDLTARAFNLADKYQTPVVVIIDKNICENDQNFQLFDISLYKIDRGKFTTETIENYQRYALSEDGISLRSVQGVGNFFVANSDEHNLEGYSTEEIEIRNEQMRKRMSKLKTCAEEDMPKPTLYGPEKADITLVSWGSNKGSILQALKNFDNVNYLHINWISPFPTEEIKKILSEAGHIVNIECNYSGQMGGLIKEKTGIEIKDNLLKYDGRPFFVEEIKEKIKSVLANLK
jgi:2-oxoglutarate/2-oxoacid ferredoxin oxidoreductase subunit alpha